MILCKPDS
jgi:hypothetical protein